MKKLVRVFLALVLCSLLGLSDVHVGVSGVRAEEAGTWTQLPVPESSISCLAINPVTPSTLYIGIYSGVVFRSTNSGTTWMAVNTGLTNKVITSLAINPLTASTLYVGTDGDGVFRSTNSGTTWMAVNMGLTNMHITSLAINPLAPSTLYAGTQGYHGGVFRSTNSGDSWTVLNTGLTDTQWPFALAINPLTPTTLYAVTSAYGRDVLRSTDSGDSWMVMNTGVTGQAAYSLAINPATPSTLYVSTDHNGVFRSTDSGTTWTAVNTGLTDPHVRSLAIDPVTPTTLYAGTSQDGIFRSTNSGDTWMAMNTGLTHTQWPFALAINPLNATLYAGTQRGLFRYDANAPRSCALTVNVSPSAGGDVSMTPFAISYAYGTVVALTATASPGYTFSGWSGAVTGMRSTIAVTMDANKTVTATFTAIPTYTLTPSAGTGGTITPNTVQTVLQGGSTTFTNTPGAGYHIAEVVVDGSSVGAMTSYTFTNVEANHTIQAVFAVDVKRVITLTIGKSTMYVDGSPVVLEAAPIILNSRTLLPIRAVVEATGGTIAWAASTQKVTIMRKGRTLELWIGRNVSTLNGQSVNIDSDPKVVPIIMSGRTLLPLRFVAEALTLDVQWNATTQAITITYTP